MPLLQTSVTGDSCLSAAASRRQCYSILHLFLQLTNFTKFSQKCIELFVMQSIEIKTAELVVTLEDALIVNIVNYRERLEWFWFVRMQDLARVIVVICNLYWFISRTCFLFVHYFFSNIGQHSLSWFWRRDVEFGVLHDHRLKLILLHIFDRQFVKVFLCVHGFVNICKCLTQSASRHKNRVQVLVTAHFQTGDQHKHPHYVNISFHKVVGGLSSDED